MTSHVTLTAVPECVALVLTAWLVSRAQVTATYGTAPRMQPALVRQIHNKLLLILSLASLRGRSSTGFGWGKGGNVTSAGWQVTLRDPMRHVSSRSSVATLRTAVHLLLTYLLNYYYIRVTTSFPGQPG